MLLLQLEPKSYGLAKKRIVTISDHYRLKNGDWESKNGGLAEQKLMIDKKKEKETGCNNFFSILCVLACACVAHQWPGLG